MDFLFERRCTATNLWPHAFTLCPVAIPNAFFLPIDAYMLTLEAKLFSTWSSMLELRWRSTTKLSCSQMEKARYVRRGKKFPSIKLATSKVIVFSRHVCWSKNANKKHNQMNGIEQRLAYPMKKKVACWKTRFKIFPAWSSWFLPKATLLDLAR